MGSREKGKAACSIDDQSRNGFEKECEWVGMTYPGAFEEMKPKISCYSAYIDLGSETDLLIKPKKETENKKTKFDEQEFLSNPYNKEFKISKVKTEKKKTVLSFN